MQLGRDGPGASAVAKFGGLRQRGNEVATGALRAFQDDGVTQAKVVNDRRKCGSSQARWFGPVERMHSISGGSSVRDRLFQHERVELLSQEWDTDGTVARPGTYAEVFPLGAPAPACSAGIMRQQQREILWQDFFSNPTLWWDFRQEESSPGRPRLRHQWSKDSCKLGWVYSQLAMWDVQVRVGMSCRLGSGRSAVGNDGSVTRCGEESSVGGRRRLCEEGQLCEAVEALELLVERGSYVDKALFYSVVKRCIVEKNNILGERVHALTVRGGHDLDAFRANHIIRMYASHARLEEAKQVFRKVPAPDTFMWCSIITAHTEHGQPTQAIQLYREMRESAVKPNSYVFVAVLKACVAAVDLTSGKEVHADIMGTAVELDLFVGSCLVDMYSKCGSLCDARRVFDSMPARNVVTWTAMIAAYVQQGRGREALSLYTSMQQEGVSPANHVTFVCLLQACASIGALHQGKQLHVQIRERGLESDLVVGNCLVNMYAKCGSLVDARQIFDGLASRDVVSWTAMIAGYAQHGLGEEALTLYASMQSEGITPADHVTFVCLLQACASVEDLRQGKQVHARIRESGLEADVVVGSSLVDMYAKCGSLEEARSVFDRLPVRNVVTWTGMLAGYVQHGLGQEALALYASMQDEGISPTDHTFVCLLKACASVGALCLGKELHEQVQERELDGNMFVGNSLVDMYAKSGRLDEARRVFEKLPTRDVVTWTALLNGYAQHSYGEMAIDCFQEMLGQGIQPNDTTFVCLLVACSHAGLVHEGRHYFGRMVDYGISPNRHHYMCMVDLLGRSGHLDEAEEMLQTMPFQDDIVVGWTSLLSACKSQGDMERATRCFDRLVTLEPEVASAYVLLGNIFANAGRWADVDRMESLRKSAGAWKSPAKAFIEVKKKVHEFSVGAKRADHISSKLRSMTCRLKEQGGHVPQTELVLSSLSETEKEAALCGHAEKLALAYGLLNTPEGTSLLVTKNLRMCNDCHSSTKIMSRLEKRDIIVRDAHRVHRFADGCCSCGDRN